MTIIRSFISFSIPPCLKSPCNGHSFDIRKAIIVFEKLKHEQVYWAQQELTHYPVYSREELISRIEYLEKETDHNKVYPLIKLAGRIMAIYFTHIEISQKWTRLLNLVHYNLNLFGCQHQQVARLIFKAFARIFGAPSPAVTAFEVVK